MSIELKIKALSLAYEAKQIARIERKLRQMRWKKKLHEMSDAGKAWARAQGMTTEKNFTTVPGYNPEAWQAWGHGKFMDLKLHRKKIVGREARLTHLARMFLKGTPYKAVEGNHHECNALRGGDIKAILNMATKYAVYLKMGDNRPIGKARKFRSEQELVAEFKTWIVG